MKKSKFTRLTALFLAVLVCFGALGFTASASDGEDTKYKENSTSTSRDEMQAYLDAVSYTAYLERYKDVPPGTSSFSVDVTKFTADKDAADAALVSNLPGFAVGGENWSGMTQQMAEKSVYLPSNGSVSFTIDVPETGMYYISADYYTAKGTVNGIERKLYIDGVVPFAGASYLKFTKVWEYQYPDDSKHGFSQDLNGNDLQPDIVDRQVWRTYVCNDSTGYTNGYFAFYLTKGEHTLTFEAVREPVVIGAINILPSNDATYSAPSYETYINNMKDKYGAQDVGKGSPKVTIEAEKPLFVSDTSVYMGNDRTSPINSPTSASAQLFNVIGATSFNTVGQWAAYSFTVENDGFYEISARYSQTELQGMFVCRTIRLWSSNRDASEGPVYGVGDTAESATPLVPFSEAYETRFDFNKKWQSGALGTGDEDFRFYFEKDVEYIIYVEVGLGSLADLIRQVEESLSVINETYLNVIKLTGADPDDNRNYYFDDILPSVRYNLNAEAVNLARIATEFEELCGTTGSHIATLTTISDLLARMGEDEMKIAKNLGTLKSYLGTLGTWINTSKSSILTIDLFSIQSPAAKAPKAQANFFQSMGYEIKAFFMSFFTDYDNMGVTSEDALGEDATDVWLALGRDQSNIWRNLIDGDFSRVTNIPVSLKLVTASTLLPSVLADKGPDVYLGLDSASVINYAIRGAIRSVSDQEVKDSDGNAVFGDFKTSAYGPDGIKGTDDDIYHEAALNTLTLLNETYGLPLTMNFPMMFYRLDVLAELGLDVPETWDDILSILTILQSNYLKIGLTYTLALDFFLYQNGGSMWKYEDIPEYAGAQIGLDTDEALAAFEFCTRLFSDYSFDVSFDAANRFRTGEMPLVISDYITVYNQLTVFATEIQGLWEFSSIPGTPDKNGKLNYDSIASVTATVMLHGCDNVANAWEFMKWQTSADVEANYGNRMVALIGPSAKYAAANLGAIEKLSWTSSENAAIQDQLRHLVSIVNFPGSYIIARYTNFAFLNVVNDGANPTDALQGYVSTINTELKRKREEFNLPTLDPGEVPPGYEETAD